MDEEKLIHIFEKHTDERVYPAAHRNAAVLIPLIRKEDGWHILFEIRSRNIMQGGEICFPGGRIEKDETPEETALRETCEELKMDRNDIQIVCPLHSMLGPAGADVSSFLGILHHMPEDFNQDEISEIFTLPLQRLLESEPVIHQDEMIITPREGFPFELIPKDYHWLPVPKRFVLYPTEYGTIWGMSGELLYQFLQLYRRKDEETL